MDRPYKRRVLVYESALTGHHLQYLRILFGSQMAGQDADQYIFLVNPDLQQKAFVRDYPHIRLTCIHKWLMWMIRHFQWPFLRDLANGLTLKYYSFKLQADELVILDLNVVQWGHRIFRLPVKKISGILFHPFVNGQPNTFGYKKSGYFMRRLLSVPQLERIWVLDDREAVKKLNELKHSRQRFAVLPDPLIPMGEVSENQAELPVNEKKIFLHYGALAQRKGVLDILDAIVMLPERVLAHAELVICGVAEPALDRQIREKISQSSNRIKITYLNDYLSDAELSSWLRRCSAVLMPYRNPGSSSGVLWQAVTHRKPVVGPKTSFIGQLISRYRLGIGVETDAAGVAEGMTDLYDREFAFEPHEDLADLLAEKEPGHFARLLLAQ